MMSFVESAKKRNYSVLGMIILLCIQMEKSDNCLDLLVIHSNKKVILIDINISQCALFARMCHPLLFSCSINAETKRYKYIS
jgi:hypothetical protein